MAAVDWPRSQSAGSECSGDVERSGSSTASTVPHYSVNNTGDMAKKAKPQYLGDWSKFTQESVMIFGESRHFFNTHVV